jgi:predicted RNase H-like nuclease (RuvC/YqgF family)
VRESIQEYEEERGIFQNQLAALEAEIGELKTNAADAKNYLEELESYSNQLERKLNAMRAEKDAEAAIYYECNDDRWFTRSTEKRIFLKKETKALLKAKSDLEKSRKELSAFKSAVAKMLYDGLPVDCITQYSVISPVFVVPSLENVDPVILNRGSVLNLESRSQGGKPKFPGAQATTIEKIYQCSGLRNMVDSVRQVLTLCGVNLEEE